MGSRLPDFLFQSKELFNFQFGMEADDILFIKWLRLTKSFEGVKYRVIIGSYRIPLFPEAVSINTTFTSGHYSNNLSVSNVAPTSMPGSTTRKSESSWL